MKTKIPWIATKTPDSQIDTEILKKKECICGNRNYTYYVLVLKQYRIKCLAYFINLYYLSALGLLRWC